MNVVKVDEEKADRKKVEELVDFCVAAFPICMNTQIEILATRIQPPCQRGRG